MAEPRWREIASDLGEKIKSGELGKDGAALPSELELRDRYEASRNTIRDAVKLLVARGLIVTRPGHGTFVAQKIDPFVTTLSNQIGGTLGGESARYASEIEARRRTPKESIPDIKIHLATGLVADELRLAEGVDVVSRHQQRFIDGTPWSLQTTFYPRLLVEKGAEKLIRAENLEEGVISYIEAELSIRQVGWRDQFIVRAPDKVETDFFKLDDDGRIAVIEIIRTGYDESGNPFRVTVTTYPADRNRFEMRVGEVPPSLTAGEPGESAAPESR
jgi:GntR family transcriptional regulator